MPIRSSMRLSVPISVLRSGIVCCTSTAQRTASTTLANSTSMPSPVVLTMRPLCSAIFGSISSRRCALSRASVPSSSAPISRLYPATSAARMAANRRSTRSVAKALLAPRAGRAPSAFPIRFIVSCDAGLRPSSIAVMLPASYHRRHAHITIELHAWGTPNGRKISVALEEMGLPYSVHPVNIGKGDQFKPDFVKISPNSKIPAIIDREGPGGQPISIFESGAILIYLGEKTGKFWPKGDMRRQGPVLEWLMWQIGGLGPMPGQEHHLLQVEKAEDRRYGLERYMKETRRLYGVFDKRLGEVQ